MIYIRADMNQQIATGHVMRCLSIAEAARELGEESAFILADENGMDLIASRGFPAIVLDSDWNDMESELPKLEQVIRERDVPLLLVDSYQVTLSYFERLKTLVKTFYIDDLHRFEYPVDGVICYANYWEKIGYRADDTSRKLCLGTEYAPVRKVFSNCPPKQVGERIESLLLMSGGTDKYEILPRMLEGLELSKYENVDVVCGVYCLYYERIKELYQGTNVCVRQNVPNLEDYIKKADVAVSAGGMTLYELCAAGVPTIVYTFADNQLDNAEQFSRDGIMAYAGDARKDDVCSNVRRYLQEYDDVEVRKSRSQKMQSAVDGQGAKRIAEALMEYR